MLTLDNAGHIALTLRENRRLAFAIFDDDH
jgi:hypothetical protein